MMSNNNACNGMARNIYQNTNRQYQYPGAAAAAAMNTAMTGIGRANPFSASSMNSLAAASNSPYSSMAAQFSSMPNSTGTSMGLRQDNLNFQDHMLHYQSY